MPLQDRYDHVRNVVPNATSSLNPFHAEPTILTRTITETPQIPRLTDCLPAYASQMRDCTVPWASLLSCARRLHALLMGR